MRSDETAAVVLFSRGLVLMEMAPGSERKASPIYTTPGRNGRTSHDRRAALRAGQYDGWEECVRHDARRHGALPAAQGSATGRVKKKVLPTPTWVSTQRVPPCASTILLTVCRVITRKRLS